MFTNVLLILLNEKIYILAFDCFNMVNNNKLQMFGILSLILMLFLISVVSATDLTQCAAITSPGVYKVTTDFTNDTASQCFLISSDDVDLNFMGHTITDGTYGITVVGIDTIRNNITIQNGTFYQTGTGVGPSSGASNLTIKNIVDDGTGGGSSGNLLNGAGNNFEHLTIDNVVCTEKSTCIYLAQDSDTHDVTIKNVRDSSSMSTIKIEGGTGYIIENISSSLMLGNIILFENSPSNISIYNVNLSGDGTSLYFETVVGPLLVDNATLFTSVESFIKIAYLSDDITFKNIHGSGADCAYFITTIGPIQTDVNVYDSSFQCDLLYSNAVYMDLTGEPASASINLYNVTYDTTLDGSATYEYVAGEGASVFATVNKYWNYRAFVNDTDNNLINNANVTANNVSGSYMWNLTTDVTGYTPTRYILDYVVTSNGTTSTTQQFQSPYTISASNVTLTTNVQYNATLNRDNLKHVITLGGGADVIFPLINYGTGTDSNNVNRSRPWIYVNVSVTETNEDTITFLLYNSTYGIINSTSSTTGLRTINWTNLVDGTYYYNVTINDTAGNENATSLYKIMLDDTTPTLIVVSPTDGTLFTKAGEETLNINFKITTSDLNGVASQWYSLDGAANVTFDGDDMISHTLAKAYTVIFCANDTLNNIACSSPISYTYSFPGSANPDATSNQPAFHSIGLYNMTVVTDQKWKVNSNNLVTIYTYGLDGNRTDVDSIELLGPVELGTTNVKNYKIALVKRTDVGIYQTNVFIDDYVENGESLTFTAKTKDSLKSLDESFTVVTYGQNKFLNFFDFKWISELKENPEKMLIYIIVAIMAIGIIFVVVLSIYVMMWGKKH